MHRPTYAEIDLGAIKRNIKAIRERVGSRVKIMPAVKANAYGHGSVEVSRTALAAGANMLGVASVEEGLELRNAGISEPVLILGSSTTESAPEIVTSSLSATTCDFEFCKALSDAAIKYGTLARIHVKVDTGMGRIGIALNHSLQLIHDILSLPGIKIDGVFTHFPTSDEPDKEFTQNQIERFSSLEEQLRNIGLNKAYFHAANSGAILAHSDSYFDLVRPGIMIYGLYPSRDTIRSVSIEPSLSLKSRIVFIKDIDAGDSVSYGRTFIAERRSKIATIPIGYADGYNRLLSNRGLASVRGKLVPVAGRICMDQTMLDVTDVPDVSLNDEVTLYGGTGPTSVEEIAALLNTIPYEVVCNINHRVPRIYLDS